MSVKQQQTALGDVAARHLAIATRTVPQLESISHRWLVRLLNWVPVEGVVRLNKVVGEEGIQVDCSRRDESVLPHTLIDYDENPREYNISAINSCMISIPVYQIFIVNPINKLVSSPVW